MTWTEPEHSRSQVNDAGVTLVAPSASPRDKSRARTIVYARCAANSCNWRRNSMPSPV